jgi:hypothetical protein
MGTTEPRTTARDGEHTVRAAITLVIRSSGSATSGSLPQSRGQVVTLQRELIMIDPAFAPSSVRRALPPELGVARIVPSQLRLIANRVHPRASLAPALLSAQNALWTSTPLTSRLW